MPRERPPRPLLYASLIGALAGGLQALSDFGAGWMWLDRPREQLGLLVALLRLHVVVGMVLAVVLQLGWWMVRRGLAFGGARWQSGGITLTFVAAPLHAWYGWYLVHRPSVAELPGARWALAGGLLVSLGSVQRVASPVMTWLAQPVRRPCLSGGWLLILAFGLGKLDQWVLPGYYEPLHGLLTGAALLMHAGACHVWVQASAPSCLLDRWRIATPWLLAAALMGMAHVSADRYQNVRVALARPRSGHSHSLALALGPALRPVDRWVVWEQRRTARRTRGRPGIRSGLTWPLAHLLVVTVDALRADHLGCYGHERPTSPGIDRLAATAVVYEHAYTPAPHSSHAIASLWTSQPMLRRVQERTELPRRSLVSELSEAGYHTAAFFIAGIFFTDREAYASYARQRFGFNFYEQTPRAAESLTDAALAEVERTVARGEPSSLFWVHYFDVHAPYRETRFGTRDVDRYDGEIARVDRAIERLVREVRARLSRDVVVVVTADHGEAFGEHGHAYHGSSLYDEQTRIPLLLMAPGLPPRRAHGVASLLDVAPTLLAAVGLPTPAGMEGRDLLSTFTEPPIVHTAVEHQRGLIRLPFKFIAEPRWSTFELYNLQDDPRELHNLSDDRPQLVAEFAGLIDP